MKTIIALVVLLWAAHAQASICTSGVCCETSFDSYDDPAPLACGEVDGYCGTFVDNCNNVISCGACPTDNCMYNLCCRAGDVLLDSACCTP